MVGHCTDCSINLTKLSCALYLQNGNGVAEAHLFTQLPVSITVIVEKFFLRLLKYTIQAG
jgi:hypothetical protein